MVRYYYDHHCEDDDDDDDDEQQLLGSFAVGRRLALVQHRRDTKTQHQYGTVIAYYPQTGKYRIQFDDPPQRDITTAATTAAAAAAAATAACASNSNVTGSKENQGTGHETNSSNASNNSNSNSNSKPSCKTNDDESQNEIMVALDSINTLFYWLSKSNKRKNSSSSSSSNDIIIKNINSSRSSSRCNKNMSAIELALQYDVVGRKIEIMVFNDEKKSNHNHHNHTTKKQQEKKMKNHWYRGTILKYVKHLQQHSIAVMKMKKRKDTDDSSSSSSQQQSPSHQQQEQEQEQGQDSTMPSLPKRKKDHYKNEDDDDNHQENNDHEEDQYDDAVVRLVDLSKCIWRYVDLCGPISSSSSNNNNNTMTMGVDENQHHSCSITMTNRDVSNLATSKYMGVVRHSATLWKCYYIINNNNNKNNINNKSLYDVGCFSTEKDAALAYDLYARQNGTPVNFQDRMIHWDVLENLKRSEYNNNNNNYNNNNNNNHTNDHCTGVMKDCIPDPLDMSTIEPEITSVRLLSMPPKSRGAQPRCVQEESVVERSDKKNGGNSNVLLDSAKKEQTMATRRITRDGHHDNLDQILQEGTTIPTPRFQQENCRDFFRENTLQAHTGIERYDASINTDVMASLTSGPGKRKRSKLVVKAKRFGTNPKCKNRIMRSMKGASSKIVAIQPKKEEPNDKPDEDRDVPSVVSSRVSLKRKLLRQQSKGQSTEERKEGMIDESNEASEEIAHGFRNLSKKKKQAATESKSTIQIKPVAENDPNITSTNLTVDNDNTTWEESPNTERNNKKKAKKMKRVLEDLSIKTRNMQPQGYRRQRRPPPQYDQAVAVQLVTRRSSRRGEREPNYHDGETWSDRANLGRMSDDSSSVVDAAVAVVASSNRKIVDDRKMLPTANVEYSSEGSDESFEALNTSKFGRRRRRSNRIGSNFGENDTKQKQNSAASERPQQQPGVSRPSKVSFPKPKKTCMYPIGTYFIKVRVCVFFLALLLIMVDWMKTKLFLISSLFPSKHSLLAPKLQEFPDYGKFRGRVTAFDGLHYKVYYSTDDDEEELSESEFEDFEIISPSSTPKRKRRKSDY